MIFSETHQPLRLYRDPAAIRARIVVMKEKAARILTYNGSLDPADLDEKQLLILKKYGLRPGVHRMPVRVLRNIKASIDFLETRLKSIERDRAARVHAVPERKAA